MYWLSFGHSPSSDHTKIMIIRPQIIFMWSDDGLCPKLNQYKKKHLDCVLFTISRKRPTNYCDIKLLEDSIKLLLSFQRADMRKSLLYIPHISTFMFGSLVSLNGQDYTLQLHEDCGKINYLSASLLYHLYNSQSTYLLRRYVGAQTSKCQQLHSLLTLTVMIHTIVNINIAITFTNIITMSAPSLPASPIGSRHSR